MIYIIFPSKTEVIVIEKVNSRTKRVIAEKLDGEELEDRKFTNMELNTNDICIELRS